MSPQMTSAQAARLQKGPQDPGEGEHLWTVLVAYKLPDWYMREKAEKREGSEAVLMDLENMVSMNGPGCFKCEEEFSPRLYYRKCKGSLEPQ